jgi:hypothetical protein
MKVLLIFIFSFISVSVFAQSKNFIITNNGDSLFGKIKLQHKVFTISGPDGPMQINADNVKKVYADNFRGNTVVHCRLYLYTDNLSELDMGYAPTTDIDTVMVLKEIYTTEKMNLYFGTDNLKSQYYFYKTPADTVPIQLVVRYYLGGGLNSYALNPAANRGEKSRIHIEENKGYVNQLKKAMGDCEAISETTWELLHYRDYSFKNLIKKYNECE